MVGDIFGVVECIVSEIVRAFCKMVRLHLQKKIQITKKTRLKILAKKLRGCIIYLILYKP